MFSSENWFGASAGFYNGVATQSLRLDNSASSLLTRTPSAGNRKTWVWSAWIKRCDTGRDQDFFTAEGSGSQLYAIMVTSGDQIQIYGASAVLLLTNQLLRDTSAWYHIAIASDTTQTTASNRLKLYLNGSEITSFATDNRASYAQDTDYGINSNVKHNIGSNQAGGNFGDYYIAEVNFIDGLSFFSDTSGTANTSFNIDSFGETKNGVWIAKKYTGSYGTQGFHLEFKQTGDGSTTASSTTIGADTANSNHYKDTNLDAHDSNMPDSPENNFSTWNALFKGGEQSSSIYADSTLSNGNLEVSVPQNSYMGNTFRPTSGKWYCEIRVKTIGSTNGEIDWGWIQATTYSSNIAQGNVANKWSATFYGYAVLNGGVPYIAINDEASQVGGAINVTMQAGDILQLALDIDNNKGFIGRNNAWLYSGNLSGGNPATGANPTATFTDDEAQNLQWYIANGTGTDVHVANFGQDSTFGGAVSAGGNADGNGIGDFAYAPPSGFLALCSANLPEPAIGPNSVTQADNHFGILTWSGDNDARDISVGASGITGTVDFTPDWAWIKRRNGSSNGSDHLLIDTSRGVNQHKGLATNGLSEEGLTAAGSSWTNFGDIVSFKAGGFNGSASGTEEAINESGGTYVAWNWKANGGTTTTNDASATSVGHIDSVYQVNTDAGFSIVTWTGNGSNTNNTIAHGLGVTPAMHITKSRSTNSGGHWMVWHHTFPDTRDNLFLNLTNGTNAQGFGGSTPTNNSTVFETSQGTYTNVNGDNYVSYVFAEIEGYSKFGTYTGTGNTDGTVIYLGFSPAWILMKSLVHSESWHIWDNKRVVGDGNPNQAVLSPNTLGQDTAGSSPYDTDFLSNGFKIRGGHDLNNGSGDKHIYMAFAENPFKYANAK